ncbi:hemerythrin domain-containing protein [Paludibacteraceae bacterium OttesenSCG-928-F17]|nr:hemerythrin domain-containing protein [Paludibacteraceae bacterium OttesenSCG-928-F17]
MLNQKYSENQKLTDLINQNASLLLVLSRFNLPLGFENKTVKEVCESNNVDTYTFLTVVNFLTEENLEMDNHYEKISLESLISFLKNGHDYFLNYKLPAIREKLVEAINQTDSNEMYREIILRFFDEYVNEVNEHMEYEDKVVFPYVHELLSREFADDVYNIQIFEERHNQIDQKLIDLKNILIKYYPAKGNTDLMTDTLLDILSCGKDLSDHNKVEDYMFIPAIEAIEKQNRANR